MAKNRGPVNDPLRPETLSEFSGQEDVVEQLGYILGSAKKRESMPTHMLFAGPPGTGKTTLARIIANEMGVPFVFTTGGSLEKPIDIISFLGSFSAPTLVFVDEIHSMPHIVEEIAYGAMEDGIIEMPLGGEKGGSVPWDLAKFTLVGATTKMGLISKPLRDRFGYTAQLQPYSVEELTKIVLRSAGMMDIAIDDEGAAEISRRSRETPRIANKNLRLVRDVAVVDDIDVITADVVKDALGRVHKIDAAGLDVIDHRILLDLCKAFRGGPVGGETLAQRVGIDKKALEEVYEPFLLSAGFMARTSRGRIGTPEGFELLGLTPTASVMENFYLKDEEDEEE